MSSSFITVSGAKEHNLKNISLKLPRNKLVVITGVSGSGKSSLAFDTLYAEGQRRYVESLSSYARQFLENLKRPDVESIDGLSPAIAIEQQGVSKNPRSTVGTITEIYDYMRLLYSRIGHAFCHQCEKEITSQSIDQMILNILSFPKGEKLNILAPIVQNRKGEYKKELHELRQQGFVKVKIDGKVYDLSSELELEKNKKHSIDVYVDRIILKDGIMPRLRQSLQATLELSNHLVKIEDAKGNETLLSQLFSCIDCGVSYGEIEPRLFSFNSSAGACQGCRGLGFKDIFDEFEEVLDEDNPEERHIFHETPCNKCNGQRLKKEALFVKVNKKSITEISNLSLNKAYAFFNDLELSSREKIISERILKEILDRLKFLLNVGVSYLSLDRRSATLSGGEGQRIRLATQIGSSLMGVLYILDEPSIGLHPKDNHRLIDSLKTLRDRGNTVLVVEHDADTIRNADYIVDMGPGAGIHGGHVVSAGPLKDIKSDPNSLTGAYLNKRKKIDTPKKRRKANDKHLILEGAHENNLKNLTAKFPLSLFIGVTGLSGSGKSSLVIDTLYRSLTKNIHRSKVKVGKHKKLSGINHIDSVSVINQSPIGKTPRSNPATYTGVFAFIRTFLAELPEAKIRGYKAGRFSFNVKGGRCENCIGAGLVKIEMHFLPNMYVHCDVCQGKRYNRETLEVRYKEKNISEILDMTIEESLLFFSKIPKIKAKLKTLFDVGLGYIHLGQQATTLSGGEAQRIKLSRELSKRSTGRGVFILDEPTTGLHFEDVKKLLSVLQKLTDRGNTVIVIEHNLEVIKSCDWVLDMGPEGGEKGGYIVAEGTPEQIATKSSSVTGQFLKKVF